MAGAARSRAKRLSLIVSGLASVVLGLVVLFNLVTATFVLLGVILGVQILIGGVTLLLFGPTFTRTR